MSNSLRPTFLDILAEDPFRNASPYISRRLSFTQIPNKALIFTGVRRSGKTTCLRQIRDSVRKSGVPESHIVYCNFSDERLMNLHAPDLGQLVEAQRELFPDADTEGKMYFFLDELQLIEGWELFVDRILRAGNKVFISGSSAKLLSRDIATAMRGRSLSFEVFPFGFEEYLEWFKIQKSPLTSGVKIGLRRAMQDYLKWGGFPEVVATQRDAARLILQEYADVLLLKDIVERNDFSHPQMAKFLFSSLLSQTSKSHTINKTHARLRSLGYRIDKTVISGFMEWCEDCYAIFQVPIYSESAAKRATHPKKIYCIDNGLATITGRDFSDNRGRLLENAVFGFLRRQFKDVYYFRTRRGYEVDFVIRDKKGRFRLFQVCESLRDPETRQREVRAVIEARRELIHADCVIVTLDDEEKIEGERGKQISVLPIWRFLLPVS